MTDRDPSQAALSSALLGGLGRFRAAGVAGNLPHGENLFSYCALARERLIAVELPCPILGVVLAGTKEVWRGMEASVLHAGALFVLPAKAKMDILNLPDDRSGFYQSIVLEVPALPYALETGACRAPSRQRISEVQPLQVRLTPHLVAAVVHAASAIADGPAQAPVRRSRMTELLALLQEEPAALPLFDTTVSARIIGLVGSDLSRDWKAPRVAAALGLSESTLRRRLAVEGTSFARLLRRERMLAARHLVERRESSRSAAVAVGYASRTHFARRFKAEFGASPSELRHRDQG